MKKVFTVFQKKRMQALRLLLPVLMCVSPFISKGQNDECANAIMLTQSATCTNTAGSTVGATLSMAASPCFGNPDDDVWFSFVATATDAKIDLSSVSSSTDMYFQVLSGTCGAFTSLLCSDPNSNIVGGLTIGQTYYIRVYTYSSGNSATFNICVSSLTAAPSTCTSLSSPAANATANITPTLSWSSTTNATSYDVYMDGNNPPTTIVANVPNATSYTVPSALSIGDYYWYVVPKNSAGATTGCSSNSRKFTVVAPPANDNCANATSITQGATCTNTAGTTVGATLSMAATPCFGNPDDDVWYSFVATATDAKIDLSSVSNSTDMYFQVLSGTCGSLTSMLCSDPNSNIVGGLTVGQTYYIRVYTYGSGNSATFNICVSSLTAAPSSCASLSSPAANGTSGTTPTLSWSSVTNATGYDIYLGTTNPPTTIAATVYNNGTTSYTVPSAMPVGDYYWYVVPKNSVGAPTTCATNSRKFTIVLPPANDDCANATTLTVNPDYNCAASTTGSTVAATQSNETAPTVSAAGTDDDVWYQFTATGTTHRIVLSNVTGVVTDMAMAIYSGNCGSLTHIQSSDPNTMDVTGLTAGQVYHVRVYTYSSTTGNTASFTICVGTPPPPPVNDNCSGAITLTVNPNYNCGTTTVGTTVAATQSNETAPTVNAAGTNDDVWYKFIATNASQRISLTNVTGGTTDMAMAIYSGSCGSLVHIQSSDPETMNVTGLTPGQTYYVRVYTYTSTVGTTASFNICVGTPPGPPANDECTGAVVLTQAATCTTTSGNTAGATQSMAATPCNGTPDDDVWYSFVATAIDAKVTLSNVAGSSTDMYFQVLSGTCGTSMTSMLCSDPNSGVIGGLTIGQTYYIRVYTYGSGYDASFDICVSNVTAAPTACATLSTPAANASVAGNVTLTWSSATDATAYDVYLDGNNPPTTLAGTSYSTSYMAGSLPAGDYYWYVAPKNSLGGVTGCSSNTRKFTVVAPLVNDEAPGAIYLTVGAGCTSTPYDNTLASQSTNEPYPSCKGSAGYAGMWYAFNAPASGAVKISCDNGGTLGDSRMALYETSNVNDYSTFSIIACDDDNGVTGSTRSLFYAAGLTPGNIYYILVDLYTSSSTKGTYCVSVDELGSTMVATSGSCATDQASVASYNASYHGWISLVDASGKINANVRQIAGTATGFASSVTVNNGALRTDLNGLSYLNRNFFVSGSGATSADLQLFYTDAELNTLSAAYGGSINAGNINVSRVAGSSCTANATGSATLLTQTSNGTANGVNWVQVNTPGFSNFFLHGGNTPLPVNMEYITATNIGSRNRIDWKTTNEEDDNLFIVEHSADGIHFSELGSLNAKGSASSYSYWDQNPVAGVNYYRVKTTNTAGRFQFSKVVTATVGSNGSFQVEAFPNPVSDVLTVKVYGLQGANASIAVCDITGKVLNKVNVDGNTTSVNMHNLPQGIYLIKYTDVNNAQTIKINKQ